MGALFKDKRDTENDVFYVLPPLSLILIMSVLSPSSGFHVPNKYFGAVQNPTVTTICSF